MRFLITAGGTREYIDPVRFISNASSGKMGCALALAAIKAGHKVTLITTTERTKSKGQKSKLLKIAKVETADEMFEAVKKHFARCDCLIMAAAVADYTPVKKSKIKIKKSNKNLAIKLRPTVDILRWAGTHKKKNQFIAGFALEDKNLRANAERKLKEKNLDMIIANRPDAVGSDKTACEIKMPYSEWLKFPRASKALIAQKIFALAEKSLGL